MQITAGGKGIASIRLHVSAQQEKLVQPCLWASVHCFTLAVAKFALAEAKCSPVESKTSLPQAWHILRRIAGLERQSIMSL